MKAVENLGIISAVPPTAATWSIWQQPTYRRLSYEPPSWARWPGSGSEPSRSCPPPFRWTSTCSSSGWPVTSEPGDQCLAWWEDYAEVIQ
jgi:hypothetical protein